MNRNFAKVQYPNYLPEYIWDEAFKNGPSKICGRQPIKYLK